MVARVVWDHEVAGSIPVTSTKKKGRIMEENAELWSYPDEESIRRTVKAWLNSANIKYSNTMSTEELLQLYRDIECGERIKNE